jgi:hypothetical protein
MNTRIENARALEGPNKPKLEVEGRLQTDVEIEALRRKLAMARAVARDLAAWITRDHAPKGDHVETEHDD